MHGSQTSRTRRAIAAKLQRELQSRSWTASELAESAQLTIADCRALLSGQGVFSQEVAFKLAQALATSKDYWLKDGMD
jgi:plasmid maintenance system antidote protein VapI